MHLVKLRRLKPDKLPITELRLLVRALVVTPSLLTRYGGSNDNSNGILTDQKAAFSHTVNSIREILDLCMQSPGLGTDVIALWDVCSVFASLLGEVERARELRMKQVRAEHFRNLFLYHNSRMNAEYHALKEDMDPGHCI